MKLFSSVLFASMFFVNSAFAEPIEVNYQSVYPPTHAVNIKHLEEWTKSFAEKTNNQLVMKFFPIGSIVDPIEAVNLIQNGMLDAGSTGTYSFAKKFPYTLLTKLPMLAESSEQATKVFWKMYEEIPEVRKDFDSVGQVLSFWGSSRQAIFSTKTPIRTPADFKGKRVLIMNPNDSEMIKSLGGIPVIIPPTEVYVGLQRGMGEIFYEAVPYAAGLRLMEVVKFVTPFTNNNSFMLNAMNKELYDELPENVKQVLNAETGKAQSEVIAKILDEDAQSSLQKFIDVPGTQLITLTEAEKNEFKKVYDQMLTSYWEPYLTSIGVKNADKMIQKAYELSKSVQ